MSQGILTPPTRARHRPTARDSTSGATLAHVTRQLLEQINAARLADFELDSDVVPAEIAIPNAIQVPCGFTEIAGSALPLTGVWTPFQTADTSRLTINGVLVRVCNLIPATDQFWRDEPDTSQVVVSPVTEFLDRVYESSRAGRIIAASDLVFDTLDDWLRSGRADLCDNALENAEPGKMTPEVMASFLTITLGAREKLKHRDSFFDEVFSKYVASRGESFAHSVLDKWK